MEALRRTRRWRSKPQRTRASGVTTCGLLALPRELRDAIYEQCLVADDMVDLINLMRSPRRWPKTQRLNLSPALLRANKQILDEALPILYGANTFYTYIFTLWDCAASPRHSALQLPGQTSPYVCILCTSQHCLRPYYTYPLRRGRKRLLCVQQEDEQQEEEHQWRWGPNASRIRRLHLTLHPHTYQQWRAHISWMHGGFLQTSVHRCGHTLQDGIPQGLFLQILVIHVSRHSIAAEEEDSEGGYAFLYPQDLSLWLAKAEHDLERELQRLATFARGAASTIVVATSARAEPRDLAQRIKNVPASRRRPQEQDLRTTIPAWALRSGQLARLPKRRPRMALSLPPYVRAYDPSIVVRITREAEWHGHLLLCDSPNSLIYDSLEYI